MGNICTNESTAAPAPIQSDVLAAWKKHNQCIQLQNNNKLHHNNRHVPKLIDLCINQLCHAIANEWNPAATINKSDNHVESPYITSSTRKWSISDIDSPMLVPVNYNRSNSISSSSSDGGSRSTSTTPVQQRTYSLTETVLNIATNTITQLISPSSNINYYNRLHQPSSSLHMSTIHGLFPTAIQQPTHQSEPHQRLHRTSSGDYSCSSSNDSQLSDDEQYDIFASNHKTHHTQPAATQIVLPDIVIQMIFDRLVQYKWLNQQCCEQLSHTKLQSIGLRGYTELTDRWLLLLLKPIQSNHTASSPASTHPSPIKYRYHHNNATNDYTDRVVRTPRAILNNINSPDNTNHTFSTASSIHNYMMGKSSTMENTNNEPYNPFTVSLNQHAADELSSSPLNVDSHSDSLHHTSVSNYLGPLTPYQLNTPPQCSSSPYTSSINEPFQLNQPINTLTYFNISGCDQISDVSLMQLQYCTQLQTINLSYCTQISDISLTKILPNKLMLQYINLCGCVAITNESITCMSELLQLQQLLLDETNITDHKVTGLHKLYKLTRLTKLSVAWCRNITAGVLYWLNNNTNLSYLDVSHTQISNYTFFSCCHQLKYLNISGLKLYEPARQFHNVAYKLDVLIMSRCKLRDSFPIQLLHYNLHELDLSYIHLSSTKLTSTLLCLANTIPCHYSDDAVDESVIRHRRVMSEPIRPTSTVPLPTRTTTSFNNDYNNSNPNTTEKLVPQLQILNLESTYLDITGIHTISRLTNIVELNLCDTLIDNHSIHELSVLHKLIRLNLNGCKITSLDGIQELIQLQDLSIDCPGITDISLVGLHKLIQLRSLDLFESYVTDNCIQYLLPLKQLEKLQICSGKLSNISLTMISTALTELRELNVSHSKLINDNGIIALTCLNKLQHLNISGTSITTAGLLSCNDMVALQSISIFDSNIDINKLHSNQLRTGITIATDNTIFNVIDT